MLQRALLEVSIFSACFSFHQTALLYTPSIILLLLSPVELYFASKSRSKNVPWSILSIVR